MYTFWENWLICWCDTSFFQDTFINPQYSNGFFQRRGSKRGNHQISKVFLQNVKSRSWKSSFEVKTGKKSKEELLLQRFLLCFSIFQMTRILVACFNLQHLNQFISSCGGSNVGSGPRRPLFGINWWLLCEISGFGKLVQLSMSSTDSDLSEFANFFRCKFAQRPGSRAAGDISKKLANRPLIMNCNLCKIEPLDPIEGAFEKHKFELFCNYWKKNYWISHLLQSGNHESLLLEHRVCFGKTIDDSSYFSSLHHMQIVWQKKKHKICETQNCCWMNYEGLVDWFSFGKTCDKIL